MAVHQGRRPDVGQTAAAHFGQTPPVVGQRRRSGADRLRRRAGRPVFGGQLGHGVLAVGQAGGQRIPGKPREHPEFLQDLIREGVNEAIRACNADAEQTIGAITGGLDLGL